MVETFCVALSFFHRGGYLWLFCTTVLVRTRLRWSASNFGSWDFQAISFQKLHSKEIASCLHANWNWKNRYIFLWLWCFGGCKLSIVQQSSTFPLHAKLSWLWSDQLILRTFNSFVRCAVKGWQGGISPVTWYAYIHFSSFTLFMIRTTAVIK